MNTTAVLYHDNCADGFGAAWSAWKKLGDAADYIPVRYGVEPPNVEQYDVVYLLDFSYPRDVLEKMHGHSQSVCRTVIVIDHHKTAQEQLQGYEPAIFDMHHSGAYLAWQYFNPREDVPQLIRYIEDRDMWWWKLPYSREVSAALWSYSMTFGLWNIIDGHLEQDITREVFISEGAAILRYMQQQTEMIWSEVGEELLKLYPEAPFVGSYHWTKDCLLKWSLRSRGDFDVSAVAREYGGGGHKNAAGFEEHF